MRTIDAPRSSARSVTIPVQFAPPLAARLAAEGLGTSLLLMAVVGSGIMAERLSAGNMGLALLANSLATGAGLTAIILTFGPISGAHLNPAVTLAEAIRGDVGRRVGLTYAAVQVVAAIAGVVCAHAMFGLPLLETSNHVRAGAAQLLSEALATFGLVAVIRGTARSRPETTPYAVGLYITAAYWFTSSTSFANPAVTLARALTNTFTGIRPPDVPGFIIAQLVGALAAALLFHWFDRSTEL